MPFLLEKDLAELEELTDEQIGFTAIHQGLGFKMGSGAELAGTTAVAKPAILKTENVVTEKLAQLSDVPRYPVAERSFCLNFANFLGLHLHSHL